MSYQPQQSYPPPQTAAYHPGQYPPPGQYLSPQPGYAPPQHPGYGGYPAPQQGPPPAQGYGGQPQYGYQPQPTAQVGYGSVPGQAVIQQQPVQFGQVPVRVQCPHCHATVNTKVTRQIGSTTWIYCLMLSCFCCCCCPFCLDCAKDAAHTCPNCKGHIGTFKQPVVQHGGGDPNQRAKYDHWFGGPGDDGTSAGPRPDPAPSGGGDGGGGDDGGGE